MDEKGKRLMAKITRETQKRKETRTGNRGGGEKAIISCTGTRTTQSPSQLQFFHLLLLLLLLFPPFHAWVPSISYSSADSSSAHHRPLPRARNRSILSKLPVASSGGDERMGENGGRRRRMCNTPLTRSTKSQLVTGLSLER